MEIESHPPLAALLFAKKNHASSSGV